jgi:type I restriction enzyme R subunit
MNWAVSHFSGTDMTENAFETDIVTYLTSEIGGYVAGSSADYDASHALDVVQLAAFLAATQPEVAAALQLDDPRSKERGEFLGRIQGEIKRRGVVDVLRKGIDYSSLTATFSGIALYGAIPTLGNAVAQQRRQANRWSVTRQLHYSKDERRRALDLAIFVNGIPLATFELKNSQTKQTVEDAVQQYKNDRDPRELLFEEGRCLAHFAVDESAVRFCTKLTGKSSWFLPFDQGWRGGAGNPPRANGYKTAYLWEEVLNPVSLGDIIEHYAAKITEIDRKTRKRRSKQIFPRYHQLDVVRRLRADCEARGVGQRYVIQHSAGSGKSNSIAWLCFQLTELETPVGARLFDTVVVVTDRINLDTQITNTVKAFTQVRSAVAHADSSADLRTALEAGTRIVISTVQKFPVILNDIGNTHRNRNFAIVIDEAHSGQGGKITHAMSGALGETGDGDEDESTEEKILRIMDRQKLLTNASYFAFTATPKPRTLDYFGTPDVEGKKQPFHVYTMRQAIDEGFILDVLKSYTSVQSYYKLVKAVENDPEFDAKRAEKKLRRFVEGHKVAVDYKASVIMDHFLEHVIKAKKIGGKARAMVVAAGVDRALEYYDAIKRELIERRSPYKVVIAFSGEHEYAGKKETESSLNGFPSSAIEEYFREDPYRILVCADKFQTGYDEPLLHTMYVDKPLSGVRAVQTLSRLNRAHPDKHDTAVIDFYNSADGIQKAFAGWYQTTILAESADPNVLHDMKRILDDAGVYERADVEEFAGLFLARTERVRLEAILDRVALAYIDDLPTEGEQVVFKSTAKAFVRTYDFLAGILPYRNTEWLKLSMLLNFLIPKLPAPKEEDQSRGILETVDMDSYRAEQQAAISIALDEQDAEIAAATPSASAGHRADPEHRRLSEILDDFNKHFGNIAWQDRDRVARIVTEDIPLGLSQDRTYRLAQQHNDEQNARIEADRAVERLMRRVVKSETQAYTQFVSNPAFHNWVVASAIREAQRLVEEARRAEDTLSTAAES